MLIANSPPAVNADTHDHGERRPNRSAAALVHPPIASSVSSTGDPAASRRIKRSVQRPRPPQKCAATTQPENPNRCRQSRTVSPGTPSRSPRRRYPSRPAASSAAPITSTTSPPPQQTDIRQKHMRRPARRSRQRPRRGRNRRTPSGPHRPPPRAAPTRREPPARNAGTPAGPQRDPPRPQHDRLRR